jgi:hypothetical protein
VAGVGFFLVAAAGIWPGVAILLFAALLGTVGLVGYASRSMRSSRLRRGPRGGDLARAVASSPWFLVRAGLVSAGLLLLGAGTSWVAVQVSALILSPDSLGQWAAIREHMLLWIGAAVAALVVWFGPGAGVLREGTRSTVAAVLPYRPMRLALGGLCVLIGVAFLVATTAGSFTGPTWQPLPTPSWVLL